jgi:GAF domain-containing protein
VGPGHSGESSRLVRELHGSGLQARTPAARAVRGRALFLRGEPGRPPHLRDGPDDKAHAAYLPLVGSRHVVELPMSEAEHVVGICWLSFGGPRTFPPEERAVLAMMAGLLGSARPSSASN